MNRKSVTLVALCLLPVFGGSAPASGRTERPDVILITIDTLRADRLGCYGYGKPNSPHIDRVAEQGVLFEQAWSTTNWTKPAVASLFTSLDPLQHLVRRGMLRSEEREGAVEQILGEEFTVLAEVLREAGYRTYGISSNPFLKRESGFAQGFDTFEQFDFADGRVVRDSVLGHAAALK
jgi:arylsulfatase A-like enzyme